jgi:hypothetical protein
MRLAANRRVTPLRLAADGSSIGNSQPESWRDQLSPAQTIVDAALEQQEVIAEEAVGAEKVAPHADRCPEAGVTSSANNCSISSSRSNGSRPSRSSLLTKVMIGTSHSPHTSKSLRVCPPMLPWRHWGGVEHHDGTVDRGQGAVGVVAEKRLKACPLCSKLITAEETEMPRSRSIAIQSERARRRAP